MTTPSPMRRSKDGKGAGPYDQSFFDSHDGNSYRAAKILLPRIFSLYRFSSVVDIGCGSAAWLRAARELPGMENLRLTGIDGEHARGISKCEGAQFIFQDMENRFHVDRHDLAICLEVAEHLTPGRAESLVEDLCNASEVVFFGAAVDGQGGTGHINEQPQSYWAGKFARFGYQPFNFHRNEFWHDPVFESCPYYIASSFLYIKSTSALFATLSSLKVQGNEILDVVHPVLLKSRKDENISFRTHVAQLVPSFIRAVKRRL